MAGIVREAYETLLHTQDGQLCDIMVDKAALEAIYEAGKRSGEEIIRDYAESTVAVADIKIAVRSQKTAKSLEFMKRAMAECDSVNINALMRAAQNGMDAIEEYLESTAYKGGAKALKESASALSAGATTGLSRRSGRSFTIRLRSAGCSICAGTGKRNQNGEDYTDRKAERSSGRIHPGKGTGDVCIR